MANNTEELEPCPFCGEEAQLMEDELNFSSNRGTVMCMNCFATSSDEDDWKDAISAWNTRALSPVNEGLLKALEGLTEANERSYDPVHKGALEGARAAILSATQKKAGE